MPLKPQLFRIRGYSIKPATKQDIKESRPLFHLGTGPKSKTGILFLHGFSGTPACCFHYAQTFIAEGYTVSAPLLAGHGTTPEDLRKISWQDWLHQTIASYDDLRKSCDEIFVVGMSLGGTLALHLASRRQDIAKLLLIAPGIEAPLRAKLTRRLLSGPFSFLQNRNFYHLAGDVKRKEGFELAYKSAPIKAMMTLLDCLENVRPILPKIKTPTLIFQSRTDHRAVPKGAIILYNLLASKQKEIVWLENSYHVIPKDFQGEYVLNRIHEEIH